VLIASIMEEYRKDAWIEIVERCQDAGVDALECNFSCPHGLPERRMGSAMGENPEILSEVCRWVMSAAKVPVWSKMTPNITHIEDPSRAALAAGCQGISAINTIRSVIGVNLETLRPEPTVEGHTTLGGYSSKAIMPIALRMCMEVARLIRSEFPGRTLSGIGGVESGRDAAQFLLLGCDTVQVCTYVMKTGYRVIREMLDELAAFMDAHNFSTLADFKGHSLQYFTSHQELVERQDAARKSARAAAPRGDGRAIAADHEWRGDEFVRQSDALSRG
jgi:dihydropyrimidine dehydrogenase (NADP+)/dihydropyrimidine dehydrogenase (NAD+) subunit PreA